LNCALNKSGLDADGKIFVEAERARLTRQLAKMKEEEGKVRPICRRMRWNEVPCVMVVMIIMTLSRLRPSFIPPPEIYLPAVQPLTLYCRGSCCVPKVGEACDIIQDVHVETYGSLDKKEKADFLLEQIRLTLAKKDFVRTIIISKKVRVPLIIAAPAPHLLVVPWHRA
jgi:hypothetical protein